MRINERGTDDIIPIVFMESDYFVGRVARSIDLVDTAPRHATFPKQNGEKNASIQAHRIQMTHGMLAHEP